MRVLIVCSHRTYTADGIAPFIKEQIEAVAKYEVEYAYYLHQGKGVIGYLRELPKLRKKIREWKPDVIHAHYGLSCLLANMATRRIPVVSTYHGTDINNPKVRRLSKIAIRISAWNIFVSHKNMELAGCIESPNASLIPCGIDDTLFVPMDKEECRKRLKWRDESGEKYVLFTKQFTNPIKNYPLAKAVIDEVNSRETRVERRAQRVELVEFKGYTREQSVWLMNAVDAVIMTSFTEGSPQVIKEAMACGCPIVSVDVGDVKERMEGVDGCYVSKNRDPQELADLLQNALVFEGRTKGRDALKEQGLFNSQIAERLIRIYESVMNECVSARVNH